MSISDDLLLNWLENLPSSGHVRLAVGAVADDKGRIAQIIARQLFWDALGRVSPAHYEEALAHQRIECAIREGCVDRVRTRLLRNLATRWGLGPGLVHDLFINAMVYEHNVHSGEPANPRIMVSEFELGMALDAINPYPRMIFDSMEPKALTSRPVPVLLDITDDLTHETRLDWDPLIESRADAEARLSAEVLEELKKAMDRIEQSFQHAGAASPQVKRRVEHFDWLARYQVLKESVSSIARDPRLASGASVDRKTVRSAVQSTAALISVKLRPPTTGRPSAT